MPAPSRESIEELFLQTLDVEPSQRAEFLSRHAGGDESLRAAVQELLDADAQAGQGDFLQSALFGGESQSASSRESKGIRSPLHGDARRHDGSGEHASDDNGRGHGDQPERGDGPDNPPADRFRLLHAYRQGGLGEVLLAHDRQLDRDVAIKQIRSKWKTSSEARERFIQEAKVTGRLEHPGIVPVYAMGTWPDGSHYYAMRFIEGETMKDVIAKYHAADGVSDDDKLLRQRELLSQFVDVCHTIEYAHSKKVLHRDIKPSNIMVGPYGETLVVDWGLAKLLDAPFEDSMTADLARELAAESGSTPTQVGGTIGTPQYMSPEQAAGNLDDIGTRTDVYLLGATLYQILTGVPPHGGGSVVRMLKQIRDGYLVRPSELTPDVPPPLEAICLKAMQQRPFDRYVHPGQIADDVNRWLADQSVSVYPDSPSMRLNRWIRQHRTATTSIAVATLLLAIGAVLGSWMWNEVRMRQLQADQERRSKQLQLRLNAERRIDELATATRSAEQLAAQEIRRGRFAPALEILLNAVSSIESESELDEQSTRILARTRRLDSLVNFYRLADDVQEQNVLSRDTKALMACSDALKTLGIWDRPDWWNGLPHQDLSPAQTDALCWDVYQQLMLMDAMLIKSMAVRLAGDAPLSGVGGMFRAAGRMLGTDVGKAEAEAALIVSDRIDRFRPAEATRLYRSVAKMRLGSATRLQGSDLGIARNGADAHSLGVLCMLSAIDPGFEILFRGYQGDDAMIAARDLFRRSATLRPDHYWSHLALGQIEYLLAERNPDRRWEDFAPALMALGHCITLAPDRCFALADRSSIYRAQARLLRDDKRYAAEDRRTRSDERLRWSQDDAQRAMQSSRQHPWVGWQFGLALAEANQIDQAIGCFVETAEQTYPLGRITDATLLKVDDLRGRAEAGQWVQQWVADASDSEQAFNVERSLALAGIRLNQFRHEEAAQAAEAALSADPQNVRAHAIRAMARLHQGDFAVAMEDLRTVLAAQPQHPWASYGLGVCLEQTRDSAGALAAYRDAEQFATNNENRAAAALGLSRVAALNEQFDLADQQVRLAVDAEPSCDLMSVARPLAERLTELKRLRPPTPDRVDALSDFIRSLSELPRVTKVQAMPAADPQTPRSVALLNADFELGSLKYWSEPSRAGWESAGGSRSSAEVTDTVAKSGRYSLHLQVQPLREPRSNAALLSAIFGSTRQVVSVRPGQTYEISCWAKAEGLQNAATAIRGPGGETLLQFDGGSYDWRRVVARFTAPPRDDSLDTADTFAEFALQIVATGSGDLWLDDLQLRSVP
ncbi:protein kinase [Roseiconus nitratireducens]|uniref:Protein kinase n=1 Tax=Roseiconus nitratireducens TaxID=2605748 RepID=A0A5M6DKX0_9BACT|nr:protein kinase [Roseiconus nitratireducens]KAA5547046.1 protein kinase [Roseiconus nitratireducens]